MESLEWSHWNGEYWTGFHLGILSWEGSSRITWPKGHGEGRVDLVIMAYLGGKLDQFGGGGGWSCWGEGELPLRPPPPPHPS